MGLDHLRCPSRCYTECRPRRLRRPTKCLSAWPGSTRTTNGCSFPQAILALGAMCRCIGGWVIGTKAIRGKWKAPASSQADRYTMPGSRPAVRRCSKNPIGGIPLEIHRTMTHGRLHLTRVSATTSFGLPTYTARLYLVLSHARKPYESSSRRPCPIKAHRAVEFVVTRILS